MEDIFLISAVCLVIISFTEFMKYILETVFKDENAERRIIIIPVNDEVNNLDEILNDVGNEKDIYLLDLGVSDKTKTILELFCKENTSVKICYPTDLEEIISKNYCLQLADKFSVI